MTQISVINLLMVDAMDYLANELMTDVSDESKVGLVRIGKLQEDPTIAELNILIRQGNDDWRHMRAPHDHHAIYKVGTHGLGPAVSEFWLRRFIIELKFFFVGEVDRQTASTNANLVLSRAEAALLFMPVQTVTDSFGETALQAEIFDSYLNEGGGPGMFAHRGQIRLEYLTERIIA